MTQQRKMADKRILQEEVSLMDNNKRGFVFRRAWISQCFYGQESLRVTIDDQG